MIALVTLLDGCAQPPDPIISTLTIGASLNEFENTIESLIEHAQTAADSAANNLLYTLLTLVRQLKDEYKDILDYTADQLTIQQRTAFEGVEHQIRLLFSHVESEHDRVDDTLDNLAIYLSDSIFADDVPRISRFVSTPAIHGWSDETGLRIRFRGKNLNHNRNQLMVLFGEATYLEPIEIADNNISFSISQAKINRFSSHNEMTLIPIELSLFDDTFLFFTNERKYRFQVIVLPNQLARVVIHYKESVPVVVDRHEREHGGATGSFESGRTSRRSRTVSVTNAPDEGYKIDASTVSIDPGLSNRCSSRETRCTTSAGVNGATGRCTIVTEHGRGFDRVTCSYALTLRFTQYKEEKQINLFQTEPFQLSYDRPVIWDIPPNKTLGHLEVTLFDGRTAVYDKEAVTSLIRISIDLASRRVLVDHNLDLPEF